METKKIAVTTDTNSGMMPHEYENQGVFVLPMPFVINGVSMLESIELSRKEFYKQLKSDANISTSQPSTSEVSEFWAKILKEYDEIVHIPTSSYLSSSCATAQMLAKEFGGKVHVVDNHRISVVLKQSVFDAVSLRDQGKGAEEIVKILEESRSDYTLYCAVESMKYLKKGGRVSPAAATIGSILKLRPVLSLKDGKLERFALPRTTPKAYETLKTAIVKDLKERFKEYAERGEMRICAIFGEDQSEVELLCKELQKLCPNIPFLFNDAMSLSIACHTGPSTVALACMRVF